MGPWKVSADGVEIWISGSPMYPTLEVASVSLIPDTIVPSNTAKFSCSSVSGLAHLLLLHFTFPHIASSFVWISAPFYTIFVNMV